MNLKRENSGDLLFVDIEDINLWNFSSSEKLLLLF